MCCRDVSEREDLVDNGLELTACQAFGHESLGIGQLLHIHGDFEQLVAAHSQMLAKNIEDRNRDIAMIQRAVLEEDPGVGHGLDQLGCLGATNGIENNTRTFAIGDRCHLGNQILFLGSDDMFCTRIQQCLTLGTCAGKGHRDGTLHVGDLDRCQPDTA